MTSLLAYDWVCVFPAQTREPMKPAKTFVVEIKRNGRRHVVREQGQLWDPKQLQSAIDVVEDTQKTTEIDPKLPKANRFGSPKER